MNLGRRNFIKKSLLASMAATALPMVLSAGYPANEKIVIGLTGGGSKAFQNLKFFLSRFNTECGAIYDSDKNNLEKQAAEIARVQGKKPLIYNDYRSLLENKDIDVIVNSFSGNIKLLIAACEAGKHIYTKIPLAVNNEELNALADLQKLHGYAFQTDYWYNSIPKLKYTMHQLQSGKFGTIQAVRLWNYSANHNSAYTEINAGGNNNSKKSVHEQDLHFLYAAFSGINKKQPFSVISTGNNYSFPIKQNENPDTMMSVFDYDRFKFIWDRSASIHHKQYNRAKGVAFICTKNTLLIDEQGWQLSAESKNSGKYKNIEIHKFTEKEIVLHISNFLSDVREQRIPDTSFKTAALIAKANQLATNSYLLKKKLIWTSDKFSLF